jgi:hypothetical protein
MHKIVVALTINIWFFERVRVPGEGLVESRVESAQVKLIDEVVQGVFEANGKE